jgi:hypothetical protein
MKSPRIAWTRTQYFKTEDEEGAPTPPGPSGSMGSATISRSLAGMAGARRSRSVI